MNVTIWLLVREVHGFLEIMENEGKKLTRLRETLARKLT
jgi:hypothetical protein